MKKLISIFSLFLFFSFIVNSQAQVSSYIFSQYPGTYTEISGDTVVAFSTSTITNPMDLDDVTYPSNRIPFTFKYNGVPYTNCAINTNGFITFGTTPPVAANYGSISATEVYDGAVSGFGIDLIGIFGTNADRVSGSAVLSNVVSFAGIVAGRLITGTGIPASATILSFNQSAGTITMSAGATSTGVNEIIQIAAASIVRGTQGAAGNKVHIIQFKNFRRNTTTGTVDNLNFQIKLYEATGKIEVVYGKVFEGPIPVFGQVGLRGILPTDFNNRTTASNWLTTTAGATNDVQCMISSSVYPGSGLTFVWGPPHINVNITVIPEGFYNLSTLRLNMRDTVTAYLRNTTTPFAKADSAKAVIDSVTFTGAFTFNNASSGTYYIEVKHRNSIETWSKSGVSFSSGSSANYDFTTAAVKAFGNNMVLVGTKYCIYSGDVIREGSVNLSDVLLVYNAGLNFVMGYTVTDVTGDNSTNLEDLLITYNNSADFVSKITP
ncbi:MAG: hypothetical protein IPL53_12625 [Ignavibacteria bacterium]|nr:hypothetical protein [Ignavibacteria bacterium]